MTTYNLNDPELRAQLVEQGWTPPNSHKINAIPTVAYLHPTAANCVTTDPTAYQGGKELIEKAVVYDRIDWLEHGIAEWRSLAEHRHLIAMVARRDTEQLNWLEKQADHGIPWVARKSATGRGYRLHQDPALGTAGTAREAIWQQMKK